MGLSLFSVTISAQQIHSILNKKYGIENKTSIKTKQTRQAETEKQKEIKGVVVLKALDSSLAITIPINMALPEYEKMMIVAFDRMCCYKNVSASDVFRTLIDWKPH